MKIKILSFLIFLWGLVSGLALLSGILLFAANEQGVIYKNLRVIYKIYEIGISLTLPYTIFAKHMTIAIFIWFAIPICFMIGGMGLLFEQSWSIKLIWVIIPISSVIFILNLIFHGNLTVLSFVPLVFYILSIYFIANR